MTATPFQKKIFLQTGVGIGIITILALFIILLNADINKQVDRIEAAKKELELRNQTIALLTGSNSDLRRATPLLKQLQEVLPDRDDLINFPRELNQQALSYGVDVGFSFGPERLGSDKEPGSIKFMMTIDGSYDSIVDFLRFIEKHRYFIAINSVDIRRSAPTKFALQTSGDIYTK